MTNSLVMPVSEVKGYVDGLIRSKYLPMPISQGIYDFLKILSARLQEVGKESMTPADVSSIICEIFFAALPPRTDADNKGLLDRNTEDWQRLRAVLPFLKIQLPDIIDRIFASNAQFAESVKQHLRLNMKSST